MSKKDFFYANFGTGVGAYIDDLLFCRRAANLGRNTITDNRIPPVETPNITCVFKTPIDEAGGPKKF